MHPLDPRLEALCLLLLSYVREKVSCVLLPSTWTFFDGWRPEISRHQKHKYVTRAFRTIADHHGFTLKRLQRSYDIVRRMPGLIWGDVGPLEGQTLCGRLGFPPRRLKPVGEVICIYDGSNTARLAPNYQSKSSPWEVDKDYLRYATGDLFFWLLSEGVKAEWLTPIRESQFDYPLGWSVNPAARCTLERLSFCDSSALSDERLCVYPAIRQLTVLKPPSTGVDGILFPYDLTDPGAERR